MGARPTMQTPSQVLAKPMFWVVDGLSLVCVVALACHNLLVVACQAEQPELEGSVSWSSQLLQCCYSSDIVLSLSPPMNGNRKRMVKRLLPAVIGALDDTLQGRRLATAGWSYTVLAPQ